MNNYTVHGVRLAVEDRGLGPAVLLVHGFPLDHTMWSAQIEVLSRRYRAIAPDLRGFGRSGVTEGTVSMEQLADDLAALLDALRIGEPVVFCGLSMGGYVAWEFCRKYAGRLRGLILCDTRSAADAPEAAAARLDVARQVLRDGPGLLAGAMLPKLFAPATLEKRPEIAAALQQVVLGTDVRGIAAAARGMAQRPDSTPILGRIRCPTLVLVGEEDSLSPEEQMRAMARAIPGAQFVAIPGAGHLPPMERPAETTAAIEAFLDGLGGGRL